MGAGASVVVIGVLTSAVWVPCPCSFATVWAVVRVTSPVVGVVTGFVGAAVLVDEAGVGVQDAMGMFIVGVGTQCAVSMTSGVSGGLRTGCGGMTGLLDERGTRLGLAMGNGGSLDALERPFALRLASQMGGHASLVWGAVSPAIEAAAGSAVVGASWGDACACVGLPVGEGASWGFAAGDFGDP